MHQLEFDWDNDEFKEEEGLVESKYSRTFHSGLHVELTGVDFEYDGVLVIEKVLDQNIIVLLVARLHAKMQIFGLVQDRWLKRSQEWIFTD